MAPKVLNASDANRDDATETSIKLGNVPRGTLGSFDAVDSSMPVFPPLRFLIAVLGRETDLSSVPRGTLGQITSAITRSRRNSSRYVATAWGAL